MHRNSLFFIIAILILFNCTTVKDLSGKYIQTSSTYIIDSLILFNIDTIGSTYLDKKQYKYQQKIYNKINRELLYKHNDYWYLDNGIKFSNLLMDIDRAPNKYLRTKAQINEAKIFFSTKLEGKNIILGKDIATGKMRYYKKVE